MHVNAAHRGFRGQSALAAHDRQRRQRWHSNVIRNTHASPPYCLSLRPASAVSLAECTGVTYIETDGLNMQSVAVAGTVASTIAYAA